MSEIIEKLPSEITFPNVEKQKISEYLVKGITINNGTISDMLFDIQQGNSSPLYKKMLAELDKKGEFSADLVDEFFCDSTVIKAYISISSFGCRIAMKDFIYLCTKIDKNYKYDYAKTITTIMLLGGTADDMEVCPIVGNLFISENMKTLKIKKINILENVGVRIMHQHNSVDIYVDEMLRMHIFVDFLASANFSIQHFENKEFFNKIEKLAANTIINLSHCEFVYFVNLLHEHEEDMPGFEGALGFVLLRYANMFVETNEMLSYSNVVMTNKFIIENQDSNISEICAKLPTLEMPTTHTTKFDLVIEKIDDLDPSFDIDSLYGYETLILSNDLLREKVIYYYNNSDCDFSTHACIKALLISIILEMGDNNEEAVEILTTPKLMNTVFILSKCKKNQYYEDFDLVIKQLVKMVKLNCKEDPIFKKYMNNMLANDSVNLKL